ncbi:MAG: T9SS type A sorting domain-containing protein [Ignavibacteriales bacterium]|nr:T9SS type A sorting domain-containing protein [Ignavibacteriales bacterium]
MKFYSAVLLFIMILLQHAFAQSSVDQAIVDRQLNYFSSQIKKHDNLPVFSKQITTISSSQYELQKPTDAFSFDCGYLDGSGNVFVSEPTTQAQKKYFANVTEAAVYYLSMSYIQYFFQTDKIPIWYKVAFASFESDLKITDDMIKAAITKYGGSLPSFAALNDKTKFEANDGIAIAYLWGELMNVSFGWWKYCDVQSINSESFVMGNWTKSTDEMFKHWRRYTNARLFETDEKYKIKLQNESDHFKFYYRGAESYCMPYMQNAIEEAYAQYSKELKIETPKKLTYTFGLECEGSKIDSTPCPGRYTGGTAWSSGLATSCADKVEDLPRFRDLVRHELSHAFQFLINPSYMPAWLSEGFACLLPDGIMSEQYIRNISGEVNCRMAEANLKLGHNPTMEEYEDYGAGINYYLLGLIMNDFILRKGGYDALKNTIKTRGQDFSTMNYSNKKQFETAFYDFYNTTWLAKPKALSIKKVIDKPKIDGKLTEPTWEKNIVIDRKFWMDYYMTVIPEIDNGVTTSIMYDDDNLYIAMDIIDANISTGYWFLQHNDAVEVDIDPDLSRGIDFKNNDMAFVYTAGGSPWYRTTLDDALISYSTTSNGYCVEISIPWNKLNVKPIAGTKFGIELSNYDRDNGVYKGAVIYSGHSWNNGIVLNGLAEVTLSSETLVTPKSCQLASPVGGEKLFGSNKTSITWNSTAITKIKLEYSSDNGTKWNLIQTDIDASLGKYEWMVPTIQSLNCLLRITDVSDPLAFAISASPFSINTVIVHSPNGGEVWQAGTTQTIKWSAVNFTKVRIAFSSNNGSNWVIIADNLNASLDKYEWLVPDVPSNQCMIIVDSKSPANNDKSDASFTIDKQVGIEEETLPTTIALYQNYPNPFNPTTTIKFSLPEAEFVDLRLFDTAGKEVKTLLNKTLTTGYHTVNVDLSDLSSGVYFYQLKAGSFVSIKKLMLMK